MSNDGFTGRDLTLTWDGVVLEGVREKNVTFDGGEINTSSSENLGWQVLLEVAAENSISFALSGITKSRVLKDAYFSGNRTKTAILTYPDGTTLSCKFFLANYKEGMSYKDAVSFDADLKSTGVPVWTPGT